MNAGTRVEPTTAAPSKNNELNFPLADIAVSLVGEPGAWLSLEKSGDSVTIRPNQPMPRRCTVRPVGLFEVGAGVVEANPVMGRLIFPNNSTEPQTYRPFTLDPNRKLRELFFPVEAMPQDDWPTSAKRWANCQAIARRLFQTVDVAWNGFTQRDLQELEQFTTWPEPLDGTALYGLTRWTHALGRCVIEVGSYRGASASVLAMALRDQRSESFVISVDPHTDQPCNSEHVRLSLSQIGEEDRLVQFPVTSDRAHALLAPGSASLVFIDGDHGYEQVKADFRDYAGLLAPGGCMVFHDYGCGDHHGLPEHFPGVRRAVDEVVMNDKSFRPLLLAHTLIAFVKE